jgi:hypothetical protein
MRRMIMTHTLSPAMVNSIPWEVTRDPADR